MSVGHARPPGALVRPARPEELELLPMRYPGYDWMLVRWMETSQRAWRSGQRPR
jgi:hypothetical protein